MMKSVSLMITFFVCSVALAQDKTIVQDTTKGKALEEVIVTSSRTNSRIENIPTRVEVLNLEK